MAHITHSTERAEFLSDIITTALEGGIGYWAESRAYHWTTKGTDTTAEIREQQAHQAEHDEPGKWFKLDNNVIAETLKSLRDPATKCPPHWRAALIGADFTNGAGGEDIDAEAADVIVQIALFGRIVYG